VLTLKRLIVVLVIFIALSALAATGAGWKWSHPPDNAPQEQLAGWTWAEAAVS
jgi:hypothetical protein